jgi:hypothetical protein
MCEHVEGTMVAKILWKCDYEALQGMAYPGRIEYKSRSALGDIECVGAYQSIEFHCQIDPLYSWCDWPEALLDARNDNRDDYYSAKAEEREGPVQELLSLLGEETFVKCLRQRGWNIAPGWRARDER